MVKATVQLAGGNVVMIAAEDMNKALKLATDTFQGKAVKMYFSTFGDGEETDSDEGHKMVSEATQCAGNRAGVKDEAEAYLRSIKKYERMLDALMRERAQIKDARFRITQQIREVTVTGSGDHGAFSGASARLVDLDNEILQMEAQLNSRKAKARSLLMMLKEPDHYTVLYRHYLLHESFETIASAIGYCIRNVYYLRRDALRAFQMILDSENGI